MSSFGVVLDTCVLYPAALNNVLLRAAQRGLYRFYWSAHILDELERNLATRVGAEAAARRVRQMRNAFEEAEITGYESLIPAMTNHPKDRHVVAAAVQAGAQVIVTSNVKDFPNDALAPHELEVKTPDEFLLHLYDLQPDVMADLVGHLASILKKPPLTVEQLLQILAVEVPHFVERLRSG